MQAFTPYCVGLSLHLTGTTASHTRLGLPINHVNVPHAFFNINRVIWLIRFVTVYIGVNYAPLRAFALMLYTFSQPTNALADRGLLYKELYPVHRSQCFIRHENFTNWHQCTNLWQEISCTSIRKKHTKKQTFSKIKRKEELACQFENHMLWKHFQ